MLLLLCAGDEQELNVSPQGAGLGGPYRLARQGCGVRHDRGPGMPVSSSWARLNTPGDQRGH
jgi:hypothetical protein